MLAAALWAASAASAPVNDWTLRHLVFNAGQWPQHPWTLWTASLAHLSFAHLAANLLALAALAALGLLGFAWCLPTSAAFAWLLAWPLATWMLLCWPEIAHFQGLSGQIHAGALVCWSFAAINGVAKPWSFVLFAGVGLKLLSEHAWSRPVAFDADWEFSLVYAADLAGAAAGLARGVPMALAHRRFWGPPRH